MFLGKIAGGGVQVGWEEMQLAAERYFPMRTAHNSRLGVKLPRSGNRKRKGLSVGHYQGGMDFRSGDEKIQRLKPE